jgi:uncharacterized Zn-finger protein
LTGYNIGDGVREEQEDMADHGVPHFQNDEGVAVIHIGAREFMCIGASAPFDHPHVYLDMGSDDEIICPYCSTLYRYRKGLAVFETDPPGCIQRPVAA